MLVEIPWLRILFLCFLLGILPGPTGTGKGMFDTGRRRQSTKFVLLIDSHLFNLGNAVVPGLWQKGVLSFRLSAADHRERTLFSTSLL
jgi:hypothetical protein